MNFSFIFKSLFLSLFVILIIFAIGFSSTQKYLLESNNYGIKLEMRCQHGQKGYHFHDRFIMILNENEKTRVWSLGTSVNSVGKRHHIIQEVNNPQNIVDAFEALWDEIDCPECLVWKR